MQYFNLQDLHFILIVFCFVLRPRIPQTHETLEGHSAEREHPPTAPQEEKRSVTLNRSELEIVDEAKLRFQGFNGKCLERRI